MELKGLILSGGKGTRLRPLTYTRAKQLMPVANKPILFYGLEAMVEAGIREIGVIVGETKEDVVEALGDGSRWNVRITYIDQPEPLGLAHAVFTAKNFLQDSSFVMYLGDNLLKNGISSLVDRFRKTTPNSQILLAAVPNGLCVEIFPNYNRDPMWFDLPQQQPRIRDGLMDLPSGPGFGLPLNKSLIP